MPHSCMFPKCGAVYSKAKGISLFEIPCKPPEVREAWIKNLCEACGGDMRNLPEWILKDHMKICSKHFLEGDILVNHVNRRLASFAVPVIFPGNVRLNSPFKVRAHKEKQLKYKVKNRSNHASHDISVQSLLYEPAVILHEESTAPRTDVTYQDAAVQVNVVQKTKVTPTEVRLRKFLKSERDKSSQLEAALRQLRREQGQSSLTSELQNKLSVIMKDKSLGDPHAKHIVNLIQKYTFTADRNSVSFGKQKPAVVVVKQEKFSEQMDDQE